MLERGRYTVRVPLPQQSLLCDWLRQHRADLSLWSLETVFAEDGPKARTVAARFEVRSPVSLGALPAPESLD